MWSGGYGSRRVGVPVHPDRISEHGRSVHGGPDDDLRGPVVSGSDPLQRYLAAPKIAAGVADRALQWRCEVDGCHRRGGVDSEGAGTGFQVHALAGVPADRPESVHRG